MLDESFSDSLIVKFLVEKLSWHSKDDVHHENHSNILMPDILNEMDSAMKECIEDILHYIPLNETQWDQASLPIKWEAWIRKMSEISLRAYLVSSSGVKSVISTILNTTVDDLKLNSWDEAWSGSVGEMPLNTVSRKEWDEKFLSKRLENKNLVDPIDKARMKVLREPGCMRTLLNSLVLSWTTTPFAYVWDYD